MICRNAINILISFKGYFSIYNPYAGNSTIYICLTKFFRNDGPIIPDKCNWLLSQRQSRMK